MNSDAGIYRSALVAMRQHGESAVEVAQARANKFRDAGDDEGAAVWSRVARAVEDLQKIKPDASDRTH